MQVPFGGYKQSGFGKELGQYALDAYVFGAAHEVIGVLLTFYADIQTSRPCM